MELPYRKCVVAVIENGQGQYLVGERARNPGAWQFPQGGVDDGESFEEALIRELSEEIGCSQVDISARAKEEVSYDFPQGLQVKIAQRYRGQCQIWYLLRLKPGASPDLARSDGEFLQLAWRPLPDIIAGIIDWKKPAYLQGLSLLDLKERPS